MITDILLITGLVLVSFILLGIIEWCNNQVTSSEDSEILMDEM